MSDITFLIQRCTERYVKEKQAILAIKKKNRKLVNIQKYFLLNLIVSTENPI